MECHLSVARPLIGRCRVSQRRSSAPLAASLSPAGGKEGLFLPRFYAAVIFSSGISAIRFHLHVNPERRGRKHQQFRRRLRQEEKEGGGGEDGLGGGARRKRPLPLVAIFVTSPPGDNSTRTHRSTNAPPTPLSPPGHRQSALRPRASTPSRCTTRWRVREAETSAE